MACSSKKKIMASHEELVAELARLERMSKKAREKLAKKRRVNQLKKWDRYDRQASKVAEKRTPAKVSFDENTVLGDLVARNDLVGGKCQKSFTRNSPSYTISC